MAVPQPISQPWPLGAIRPQRAPVVPRARRTPDGESLPIEQLIAPLLSRHGVIEIRGVSGSGKTTALAHILDVFSHEPNFAVLDENELWSIETTCRRGLVVAACTISGPRTIAVMELSGWREDEWIEYLLAMHRDRCASVMSRIKSDKNIPAIDGSPELWRIVLDTMAGDESIQYVATALRKHIESRLCGPSRALVRHECLRRLMGPQYLLRIGMPDMAEMESRLFSHRAIQVMVAAEHVMDLLNDSHERELLQKFPIDLIEECAVLARPRPAVIERLNKMMRGPVAMHAVAASILLAADASWRPQPACALRLGDAQLPGAHWQQLDLTDAVFDHAHLPDADLSETCLDDATANFADFSGAKLCRASLNRTVLQGSNLTDADLAYARGESTDFEGANLARARLDGAKFEHAIFRASSLRGTRFMQANLHAADFSAAAFDHIDFTGAELHGAKLDQTDLRTCKLQSTSFRGAEMLGCNFEQTTAVQTDFSEADLTGALFTGSFMLGARFRRAKLNQAGLADVNWEHADLRDVDFTAASFHLGSARSGLVGSTIASEGTRTGFYTDDYDDRELRPPEEIRKANLRGADLRGAIVEGTDWYLVDLRDAKYSRDQAEHFKECGAIL